MTSVMSRMRPEDTGRQRPASTDGGAPDVMALLPIGADLLPRQTASRGGGRSRRLLAVGIVLVAVVAVAGAYLFALHAKSSADGTLATAQDQQRSLQTQQKSYAELVATQSQATALRNALAGLMGTDVPWSTLLGELGKVRGGVTFTSLQGTLSDPTAAVTTTTAVPTPGAIGTLSISGTAADKPTIAAFVEAVGAAPGLADPFLSSVTALSGTGGSASGYSFTVTVALTDDLRSAADSRWTTTTGGGK